MTLLINELKRRNVIRVGVAYLAAAWLIIQVAEATFPAFDLSNNALRILIIVLATGLIPALVFSWAYELTPQGIRKEKDVDRSASITPHTGKKLDRVIMVLLALAVGYFLFDRLVLSPEREAEIAERAQQVGAEQAREEARLSLFSEKSIAVLPFANRSSDVEDEYFTDGMHDELLTRLAKIAALRVISRTSVLKYRNSGKSVPEIAKELSVATILEGAVQRIGDQVRINVQLIDARSDEHLWAELFDRKMTTDNLFAIQTEISTRIAEALQARLTPEEASRVASLPTDSLEAYNLYLRGRQLLAEWRPQEASQALEAFQQAVDIDPNYAQAWVGIADALTVYRSYRMTAPGFATYQESLEQRKQAVETALALDDQLGEAYTALGALLESTGEGAKAGAAYQKGIELSPGNAQALEWYADWTWNEGQREEALAMYYKAAELDPFSSIIQSSIGSALELLGRGDEALEQFLRIIEFDPDFAVAYRKAGDLYLYTGQLAEAASYYRNAIRLDPQNGYYLRQYANVFLALEDYESVKKIQQTLRERLGDEAEYYSGVLDWFVYAGQGKWQEIFRMLEEAPEGFVPPVTLHRGLATAYYYARDYDRAREHLLLMEPGWADPEQWQELLGHGDDCRWGRILKAAGDEKLGDALLQEALIFQEEEQERLPEGTARLAYCYLLLQQYQTSIDWMEKVIDRGADWTWFMSKVDPAWDPVRNDPRYLDMAERMQALLDEQRETMRERGYFENVIP